MTNGKYYISQVRRMETLHYYYYYYFFHCSTYLSRRWLELGLSDIKNSALTSGATRNSGHVIAVANVYFWRGTVFTV